MPFAVILPGRAAASLTEPTPNSGIWVLGVSDPAAVPELCITMTKPLCHDQLGIGVCYRIPPATDLEFLGVLSNGRPSDIFFTRWPWVLPPGTPLVELVLQIESAALLMEKMAAKPPVDVRLELAKKTALNLFRFVESYGPTAGTELVRNPTAVLDAWYARVEAKSKIDPNFVVKTE